MKNFKPIIARAKWFDKLFGVVGVLALLMGLVTLVALILDLFLDGSSRLSWSFLMSFPSRFPEKSGILSAWVGSSVVMFVTALAAVPLGIATGIYLEEYAKKNWFTEIIEVNITNLAGVPSIVYGLMALGFFVYKFGLGESVLAAGLTLGLLILPIIIITTRESLRGVPQGIREAAFALGATKWQMVAGHLLPYSMGGILTGMIIGLSRAIGETAPIITIGALTFIAFLPSSPIGTEFPFLSLEWLFSPFTVLPIQMFNWVSRPQVEFHFNAAAAGLILVLMTLLMNGIAIFIRYRFRKRTKW